jgi:hypothetical protein
MNGRFQIDKYVTPFLPQHSTDTKINPIINTEANYKYHHTTCRKKSNIYLAPSHRRSNTNKH